MSEPSGWSTPEGWGPPSAPTGHPPPAEGASPPAGSPTPDPYPTEIKPGVVPLRPLGLGELLDGSVGILRGYPRPTLGFAAVVAILSTLCLVALQVTVLRPLLEVSAGTTAIAPGDTEAIEEALGGALVGGLLAVVLTVLSTAVLTGMLTAVVGRGVLGQPIGFSEAWSLVRPYLLRLVWLALVLVLVPSLVLVVGVFVGLLLIAFGGPLLLLIGIPVIVAGIAGALYLYFRWSLAPCVVVLEKTGVGTGLRRSWLLVKGDWWRVFGILLLTFVVALFVSLVIQVPFELLGSGSLGELSSGANALTTRSLIASSIGGIVAATLVEPFSAGVRALLYVDRRMRAEGLDVALTAAADSRT